jgi:replicative DNA helicase
VRTRRPTLAQLRESGAIEQDADLVLLLHREDYYREQRGDAERDNIAELIVAKQRSGRTGIIRLRWWGDYCRFGDLARGEDEDEDQEDIAW